MCDRGEATAVQGHQRLSHRGLGDGNVHRHSGILCHSKDKWHHDIDLKMDANGDHKVN